MVSPSWFLTTKSRGLQFHISTVINFRCLKNLKNNHKFFPGFLVSESAATAVATTVARVLLRMLYTTMHDYCRNVAIAKAIAANLVMALISLSL